jgi:hypothetical protein
VGSLVTLVVFVIGDTDDGNLEFLCHTEADLETVEGREKTPATKMAYLLLETFRKMST